MRTLRCWTVGILAAGLLAGCGSDSDGGDDDAGSRGDEPVASPAVEDEAEEEAAEPAAKPASEAPSETAAPTTVARERFCPDLDLAALSTASGSSTPATLGMEFEPGETRFGVGEATGWICVVNLGPHVLIAAVSKQTLTKAEFRNGVYEPDYMGASGKCAKADTADLAPWAIGYDCAFSGDVEVAIMVRHAHLDGAAVRCQLQSTDPKDLRTLVAMAPDVCPLVLEAVAG